MHQFFERSAGAATVRTWAVYALIGLGVLLALYYVFRADPIPVDTGSILRAPMRVTIDEEGVTSVRELYVVSAPVGGRVRRLDLKVGDRVVEKRNLVASIEPASPAFLDERSRRSARAMFHAAQAGAALATAKLNSANAELEYAQTDFKRAETLARRETVSQKTLDQARLEVAMRKAAVDSAKAELMVREQELESARANMIEPGLIPEGTSGLCCVQVMAPATGQIIKVHSESEKVIAQGTPILEIGDPKDLEIIVELLSSDAVKLKVGAPAEIVQWGGNWPLKARIRRIEPTAFTKVSALGIDEQRVKVHLDIDDPHERWKLLGHDYRVYAKIELWSGTDVVQVPLSALFRKGNEWSVYVERDGTAELRTIRIGARNDLTAQIIEGLQPDEKVVLHPSDRIADGVRIIERKSLN